MEIIVHSPEELQEFAQSLASKLKTPSIVCLKGDLGVGKTTLARSIIRCLLKNNGVEVTSPTFNLVHTYDLGAIKIWHFDLYRLEDKEEVYELGIEDAVRDIAIIEWPEIAESILPSGRINISLSFTQNEGGRKIEVNYLK